MPARLTLTVERNLFFISGTDGWLVLCIAAARYISTVKGHRPQSAQGDLLVAVKTEYLTSLSGVQ